MNKRWICLMLAALMLLNLFGCTTGNGSTEPSYDPDGTHSVEADPTGDTTLPGGVVYNPDGGPQDLDELDPTVESTTVTEPEESTEGTTPTETEGTESTEPSEPSEPSEPPVNDTELTDYEWYESLSGEEQLAHIESFESIKAFFVWYNAAKAEYEALHPDIDVGDGNVDLSGGAGGSN